MKIFIFVIGIFLLMACDNGNPTDGNSKTPITQQNVFGMWYLSHDGYVGKTKIDGVVTGTYNEQYDYHIDSTEVYLFGQTTFRWYYPDYFDDCYEEDTVLYSIQNGDIICDWFEDEYDMYDSVNGYFENWLFQETYLKNDDWIVIWREVGKNEDGEYDGLYTAVYKKYTENLPNPNWPYEKCTKVANLTDINSQESLLKSKRNASLKLRFKDHVK